MVALVGPVSSGLLAALAGSPNVAVVRAADASAGGPQATAAEAGPGGGWQRGAQAMREAARRRSTYVVVADDPLAGVAAAWQAMWAVAAGPDAAARFEEAAADALAAWQADRFELPDYYLVVAPPGDPEDAGGGFYLGPLRAGRPRRVAVATVTGLAAGPGAAGGAPDYQASAASLLDSLRSLEHGPWWPPLAELLETTRRFYAGGLAETQAAR